MEIRFTELAQKDLEAITAYLVENFPDKSESTFAVIESSCHTLGEYPNLGKMGEVYNTRELKIASLPFRIIYRQGKIHLSILRIYHTSRKPLHE